MRHDFYVVINSENYFIYKNSKLDKKKGECYVNN